MEKLGIMPPGLVSEGPLQTSAPMKPVPLLTLSPTESVHYRWTLMAGRVPRHWFRVMSSAHKRDISGRGWL